MRIRILCAVLFCAAVSFYYFVWLSDPGAPVTVNLAAHPLIWLSDEKLVVGHGSAVSLYNVKDGSQQKIRELLGENPKVLFDRSCASNNRVVMNIEDGEEPTQRRQHWVAMSWEDTQKPLDFRIGRADKWRNPVDCSDSNEPIPDVVMDALRRHSVDLAYDRQRDRYFWSGSMQGARTSLAWWATADRSIESQTTVPAGAWRHDGGFNRLMCFFRRCECSSNFRMYAVNGRLFALVWGCGIVSSTRGLYELIAGPESASWKALVTDSSDVGATVVFSPSGCQAALSFGWSLKLLNLCAGRG